MFHETNIVTNTIITEAAVDRVWEAWTDCQRLEEWFADEVEGWPGVGSTLTLKWRKFGFTIKYKISESDPRQYLMMKTKIPGSGTQRLTLDIKRRAPKTIVTLSESGPDNHRNDPKESGVDSGWIMALAVMKHYVENHFAKSRQTFCAWLPAECSYQQALHLYSTPHGLNQWLCRESSLTSVGQPYHFTLDSGDTMSGTVLAVTDHEVALSWRELNGILELKSFPIGADKSTKALCMRGCGWGITPEQAMQAEQFCKDSLVKLFAAISGTPGRIASQNE